MATTTSKDEVLLPRTTRSTLAQLHSGNNTHLITYQARIHNDPNKIVSHKCPNCPEYHTTNHLFNCQQNPTSLTVKELLSNPIDTASFLGLTVPNDDNLG